MVHRKNIKRVRCKECKERVNLVWDANARSFYSMCPNCGNWIFKPCVPEIVKVTKK